MNLFYNLPQEIQQYIYEYDSTYKEYMNNCMKEMYQRIKKGTLMKELEFSSYNDEEDGMFNLQEEIEAYEEDFLYPSPGYVEREGYFDRLISDRVLIIYNLCHRTEYKLNYMNRQAIHNNYYLQKELPERYKAFVLFTYIPHERLTKHLSFPLVPFSYPEEKVKFISKYLHRFPRQMIEEAILKNEKRFGKQKKSYSMTTYEKVLLKINIFLCNLLGDRIERRERNKTDIQTFKQRFSHKYIYL